MRLKWGTRIEPKHLFLKLFGRFRDVPAKSRDIPPKKFDSLGFEGHTELFGPHPFTWKTPTPPKISGLKSLGLGSFFRDQPEVFQTEGFSWTCTRDVRSKMLVFLQDLEGLTEVFGRMSAGMSGQKLLLWAAISFLIFRA